MKLIKTAIVIFALFVSYHSNAQLKQTEQGQQEVIVPKFQASVLVLRTLEFAGVLDPTLTISDGSSKPYSLSLKFIGPKNDADYTRILASVMNQLKKQGYKVISSNSGGTGDSNWTMLATAYIFQKD